MYQNKFERLPKEIMLQIYHFLTVQDMILLSYVDIFFSNRYKNNEFWLEKFKLHFTRAFEKIAVTNIENINWQLSTDWYNAFIQEHANTYIEYPGILEKLFKLKSLDIKRKEILFPLVKEGNLEGLKANKLEFKDCLLEDKTCRELIYYARSHQNILDYIYGLAQAYYSVNLVENHRFRKLVHWAILCHQDPETVENTLNTPFWAACSQDLYRMTPIHYAAKTGQVEIISMLLNYHGVNINEDGYHGITPLLVSVDNNQLSAVSHLLELGANPSIAIVLCNEDIPFNFKSGCTPLHWAVKYGYLPIVKELLKYVADVNCVDLEQYTPLHYATYYGRHEMIELFIEHGADVNAKAVNGITPLLLAVKNSCIKCVRILLLSQADLSASITQTSIGYQPMILGDTALHVAFKLEHKEIIMLLLNNNADIDICNDDGLNAISLARKGGDPEILAFFETKKGIRIEEDFMFGFGLFARQLKTSVQLTLMEMSDNFTRTVMK